MVVLLLVSQLLASFQLFFSGRWHSSVHDFLRVFSSYFTRMEMPPVLAFSLGHFTMLH